MDLVRISKDVSGYPNLPSFSVEPFVTEMKERIAPGKVCVNVCMIACVRIRDESMDVSKRERERERETSQSE